MLPKDPAILVSVVNTKLRDYYPSLSDLSEAEDVSESEIVSRLAAAGYSYDPETNSFKQSVSQ